MPSPVVDAAVRFRAQALARERGSANRLVQSYGRMYQRLGDAIAALEERIAAAPPTAPYSPASIARLEAMRSLRRQALDELNKWAVYADQEISQSTSREVVAGLNDSRAMVQSYFASPQAQRAIAARFDMLPAEQVETMLGFLAEDSPLHQNFTSQFADTVVSRLEQQLVDGIALGYNPRKVAAIARRELGVGLQWALTTARTANLNAYREATRANYAQNRDVVDGWIWFAEIASPRTCMSCVAKHGSRHPVDEPLNDHHNGRCLLPGAMIETFRGKVAIEDVKVGDFVLTHKLRWREVTAIGKRQYKGTAYWFCKDDTFDAITVTPEHPMLTQRGWVAAMDCNALDTFATLYPTEDRASSRRTVQPSSDSLASRRLSDALLSCQHGSCSTANMESGNAKSILYPSTASCGTGDNPTSCMANSISSSFALENVSQLRWRHWATAAARRFCASPFCIREIASGFAAIWRFAATLDDMGSMFDSFIQRMMVRVLTPSSAQSCLYVAPSSMYLRRKNDSIDSPNRATVSESYFAVDSSPTKLGGIPNPNFFERWKTALYVRPGNLAATSTSNIVPCNSRINASSDAVHFIPGIEPPVEYGTIIHQPLSTDKLMCDGMVYNLSVDEDESYIANRIVVHNCVQIPSVPMAAELGIKMPEVQSGEDYFNGLPEAQQRARMGPAFWQAWKDGKFGFDQLSTTYEDPTYGTMWRESTLTELVGEDEQRQYVAAVRRA